MAKKTARVVTKPKVTSFSNLRASRAMDAVVPAFVQWCKDTHEMPAEIAMGFLKPVEAVVVAYFELTPSSVATAFEVEPFAAALEQVYTAVDNEGEDADEDVMFVFEAVHLYVEFLGDAGVWTGTEEDYDYVHDVFHISEEDAAAELEGPALPPEEELSSFDGTELVRRMENLLRWLGNGKEVTSTGLLRLKDIEAAAAAVGVAAKGGRPNAKRQQIPFFEPADLPEDTVLTVRSMNELPKLMKFWVAMDASNLIEVGSTRVWPTRFAEELLVPGHPGRLGILREFVVKYLAIAVHGEDDWNPAVQQAGVVEATLLFAALRGEATDLSSLQAFENAAESVTDFMVAHMVRERLGDLAELGLLTVEPVFRVLPALQPAVNALMQYSLSMLPADDEEDWDELAGIEAEGGPVPAPGAKTKLLQLKVMLKGSTPPIWRRLVVRSDVNLAQLHHIIQRAFGWMDCHLHEFRVGGYNGTEYGPVGPEFDFGDPMPKDETGVTLGDILSKVKDKMDYIYDFGDNWGHVITLEKVLEYDGGAAARCSGGRGAGPAEDCGGVWGWENIGTIMADPTHAEYQEYRDWLGLAAGEVFDAKEFDADLVDEVLADMF